MLNVVMLRVVMLNVVAPNPYLRNHLKIHARSFTNNLLLHSRYFPCKAQSWLLKAARGTNWYDLKQSVISKSWRKLPKCSNQGLYHKTFLVYIYSLFYESYIFSHHWKIRVTLMQWPSLQESVSKFTPKQFHKIDPRTCITALIYSLRNKLECLSLASLANLV